MWIGFIPHHQLTNKGPEEVCIQLPATLLVALLVPPLLAGCGGGAGSALWQHGKGGQTMVLGVSNQHFPFECTNGEFSPVAPPLLNVEVGGQSL